MTGEWPKPGSRMQPLWRPPEKFNLNWTQSFFTTRKYRFYVLDAFEEKEENGPNEDFFVFVFSFVSVFVFGPSADEGHQSK